MNSKCSSAVGGASGRDFAEILPKPAPWRCSELRRGCG